MSTPNQTLDAILRTDFYSFTKKAFKELHPNEEWQPSWHIEAMAYRLQQVAEKKIDRLILTLPPRHLKSLCATVALPAWLLGEDPTRDVLCVSYSQELANKHARDRRDIMTSSWYKKLFPKTRLSKTKNTESEFATTKGGECLSNSVGGSLTGRGGGLVLIDDPIKADDATSDVERNKVNEWYRATLYQRLNNKGQDPIVIAMQRVHHDDLVGCVLDLDDWTHLNLPAIATHTEEIALADDRVHVRQEGDVLHPERESREVLDRTQRIAGSAVFAAQYQQSPVPPGGNIIKRDWFKRCNPIRNLNVFSQIVQSWDTAIETGDACDYSVCQTWGVNKDGLYLVDVVRERLAFPDLLAQVRRLAEQYQPHRIIIEKAGSGHGLLQSLSQVSNLPVVPIEPKLDKLTRLAQVSAIIEGGKVWLPREAPWLADFLHEVLGFPAAKYDDQVDAMSQFLRWTMNSSTPQLEMKVTAFGGGHSSYSVRDRWAERNGTPIF